MKQLNTPPPIPTPEKAKGPENNTSSQKSKTEIESFLRKKGKEIKEKDASELLEDVKPRLSSMSGTEILSLLQKNPALKDKLEQMIPHISQAAMKEILMDASSSDKQGSDLDMGEVTTAMTEALMQTLSDVREQLQNQEKYDGETQMEKEERRELVSRVQNCEKESEDLHRKIVDIGNQS